MFGCCIYELHDLTTVASVHNTQYVQINSTKINSDHFYLFPKSSNIVIYQFNFDIEQ